MEESYSRGSYGRCRGWEWPISRALGLVSLMTWGKLLDGENGVPVDLGVELWFGCEGFGAGAKKSRMLLFCGGMAASTEQ